ncbi:MAG TPA: restriction endonuclease [Acidimicrobiales bacterium]|nr:restriction endonuclease [Acidimicrobiales bacterium]
MTDDDDLIDRYLGRFPNPDLTSAEFEEFVRDLFESVAHTLSHYEVRLHDVIPGVDGRYDFDATVRFEVMGAKFLVVVEAKRHANPIKRELVQVLHQKKESVGAHKAVLVSTAKFQRGAVNFATVHGMALVHVTEGRFNYETRAAFQQSYISREQARALGIPEVVGLAFSAGREPGHVSISSVGPEVPERVRQDVLGVTAEVSESH